MLRLLPPVPLPVLARVCELFRLLQKLSISVTQQKLPFERGRLEQLVIFSRMAMRRPHQLPGPPILKHILVSQPGSALSAPAASLPWALDPTRQGTRRCPFFISSLSRLGHRPYLAGQDTGRYWFSVPLVPTRRPTSLPSRVAESPPVVSSRAGVGQLLLLFGDIGAWYDKWHNKRTT